MNAIIIQPYISECVVFNKIFLQYLDCSLSHTDMLMILDVKVQSGELWDIFTTRTYAVRFMTVLITIHHVQAVNIRNIWTHVRANDSQGQGVCVSWITTAAAAAPDVAQVEMREQLRSKCPSGSANHPSHSLSVSSPLHCSLLSRFPLSLWLFELPLCDHWLCPTLGSSSYPPLGPHGHFLHLQTLTDKQVTLLLADSIQVIRFHARLTPPPPYLFPLLYQLFLFLLLRLSFCHDCPSVM